MLLQDWDDLAKAALFKGAQEVQMRKFDQERKVEHMSCASLWLAKAFKSCPPGGTSRPTSD